MIFIAIGSNLPSRQGGSPRQNCQRAVDFLKTSGIDVVQQSRWYRSEPVPRSSGQPWFVNGVVAADSVDMPPVSILELLHEIEADFGRLRTTVNAPRTLDLDLIDFDGQVCDGEDGVVLPHPRMHERAFVLEPLSEIAPDWTHPISGLSVFDLIGILPPGQVLMPIP